MYGAIPLTVTTAPTAGLTSGSDFPIGTTTVTMSATDASGLTSTLRFVVNVTRIPPGTVSLVVNSPDDGTVLFSSSAPAFNTSVVISGGAGRIDGLQVVPGSYIVSYSLPPGFGVTSGSCTSPNGTVNTVSRTLSLTFARGESYVCTLEARDSAGRMSALPPPIRVLRPAPPSRRSAPLPPLSTSAPLPPYRVSLSAPPPSWIVSGGSKNLPRRGNRPSVGA